MKHTLALFLKTGCVVCIFLLLCLAAVHHFKPALSSLPVFSRFERKLPIYCVQTDEKKVAGKKVTIGKSITGHAVELDDVSNYESAISKEGKISRNMAVSFLNFNRLDSYCADCSLRKL